MCSSDLDLLRGVDVLVDIAERHQDSESRTTAIQSDMRTWLMDSARSHGVQLNDEPLILILNLDVKLNTQGIEFWLDHR